MGALYTLIFGLTLSATGCESSEEKRAVIAPPRVHLPLKPLADCDEYCPTKTSSKNVARRLSSSTVTLRRAPNRTRNRRYRIDRKTRRSPATIARRGSSKQASPKLAVAPPEGGAVDKNTVAKAPKQAKPRPSRWIPERLPSLRYVTGR